MTGLCGLLVRLFCAGCPAKSGKMPICTFCVKTNNFCSLNFSIYPIVLIDGNTVTVTKFRHRFIKSIEKLHKTTVVCAFSQLQLSGFDDFERNEGHFVLKFFCHTPYTNYLVC